MQKGSGVQWDHRPGQEPGELFSLPLYFRLMEDNVKKLSEKYMFILENVVTRIVPHTKTWLYVYVSLVVVHSSLCLCLQGVFPVSYVHLKKATVSNRGWVLLKLPTKNTTKCPEWFFFWAVSEGHHWYRHRDVMNLVKKKQKRKSDIREKTSPNDKLKYFPSARLLFFFFTPTSLTSSILFFSSDSQCSKSHIWKYINNIHIFDNWSFNFKAVQAIKV